MNNNFCKKCYGKLYCTHNTPKMNADDIINEILTKLTTQNKKNNIQTLYYYLLPSYRNKMNGFRGFQLFIQKKFPYLLTPINIQLTKSFQQTDECEGYFTITTIQNNKPFFITIHLQRAFNYIDNKPLYDHFTKEYLYLYWRISGIEKTNYTKNTSRIVYSRF